MKKRLDRFLARRLYEEGFSSYQIAEQLGFTPSYIHLVCKNLGPMRSQQAAAVLRQPAKSKHWNTTRRVARHVWIRSRGPIPKGMHVHHKDHDYTNNAIGNLELLTPLEHKRKHNTPCSPEHEKKRTYWREWARERAVRRRAEVR